ncbi:MAG: LuxR C-terminal-related transcriptional regulator [Pseudomonadota bacterium]|nr:LuxR C-terminal-related transcriptional regulator [Pseudomonadota bacterium]
MDGLPANSLKNVIEASYDQVSCITYPLFKNTPISFFCYERIYDTGEALYLGTGPDLAAKIIAEDLLPTFEELNLFHTFGLRTTFLSHHMPLPAGAGEADPEKYHKLINCAGESKQYHALVIVDRQHDHYRMCIFSVSCNLQSVFNFYLNIITQLEHFIDYFEHHADELIESRCQDSLLLLPNYHRKVLLAEPDIKVPINFKGLNFAIESPSKYLNKNQRITQRQMECLALIAEGHTMKTAAKKMHISPRTVEMHLRNIKEKHHVNTKRQLIEIWHDHYHKNKIHT